MAVTAPAHATSKLLVDMVPEVKALDDIHYPTVCSVTLAYPKEALKDEVRRHWLLSLSLSLARARVRARSLAVALARALSLTHSLSRA